MHTAFESLNNDKQKTIINAAMKEFVKGGYDKASINNIVNSIGISKGSIFYYFGNKKQMYLYLFDYSNRLLSDYLDKHVDFFNLDLLSRIAEMMKYNVILLNEYPLVYAFIKSVKNEKSKTIFEDIQKKKIKAEEEVTQKIYKNIDVTLFKEGIDIDKAIFIISTTVINIVQVNLIENCNDCEKVLNIIYDYIDFFRKSFYK